ncbi:MAG: GntR family transcriptional regulator [Anaerolineales bacterium]
MSPTDSDLAYRRLKERIVTVEMRPGSVIREAELMSELKLGRTPIREALKRLEVEDLVISAPHRGTHVAEISITDLTQMYEVRVELENLSARQAARRVQPHQLEEMRTLAAEYQQRDRDDLDLLFKLDRRFHMALAGAANNRFLSREIDRYYNLSLRIWYLALRFVRAQDVDVQAHLEMIDCVAAGDDAGAEAAMREHLRHFHSTIKHYL